MLSRFDSVFTFDTSSNTDVDFNEDMIVDDTNTDTNESLYSILLKFDCDFDCGRYDEVNDDNIIHNAQFRNNNTKQCENNHNSPHPEHVSLYPQFWKQHLFQVIMILILYVIYS